MLKNSELHELDLILNYYSNIYKKKLSEFSGKLNCFSVNTNTVKKNKGSIKNKIINLEFMLKS